MLFVRKSTTTYPKEVVVDVNQSTGFSKQALKSIVMFNLYKHFNRITKRVYRHVV
jgi:hypothetical protein